MYSHPVGAAGSGGVHLHRMHSVPCLCSLPAYFITPSAPASGQITGYGQPVEWHQPAPLMVTPGYQQMYLPASQPEAQPYNMQAMAGALPTCYIGQYVGGP